MQFTNLTGMLCASHRFGSSYRLFTAPVSVPFRLLSWRPETICLSRIQERTTHVMKVNLKSLFSLIYSIYNAYKLTIVPLRHVYGFPAIPDYN